MSDAAIFNLAILEAKVGQQEQLRDALSALVAPTRQEPGCLDYTLFERADAPGTFYMRESFQGQESLEAHFRTPHFKAFQERFDELLARPLELVGLKEVL